MFSDVISAYIQLVCICIHPGHSEHDTLKMLVGNPTHHCTFTVYNRIYSKTVILVLSIWVFKIYLAPNPLILHLLRFQKCED